MLLQSRLSHPRVAPFSDLRKDHLGVGLGAHRPSSARHRRGDLSSDTQQGKGCISTIQHTSSSLISSALTWLAAPGKVHQNFAYIPAKADSNLSYFCLPTTRPPSLSESAALKRTARGTSVAMSPLNKHETGSDAGLPRYGDVEQFQLADAGTGREETEEPLLAAGTTNDKEQQHQHQYGQGHYGQSGISDQPAMLPARRSRRRQQRRFAWGTISESHVRIVSRWLLRIISIYLATTTIVFLCFDYLFAATNVVLPRQPYRRVRKAMLVVAHPDDECLFFSPTLGTLSSRLQDAPRSSSSSSDTLDDQQQLSILVMSSGNNYGLGDVRGKELLGSCAQFNVPEERCVHLDEPDIQDNPTVWWPTDRIASLIGKYADQWGIDTIFTFDDGGISGHINHRAVSASVQ